MDITNIPPPRVPLLDERTGLMSREWYRFLLNIFTLVGSGTSSTTIVDVAVEPASRPVNTAAIAQEAQMMQRMARYDAAISALQGMQVAPIAKPNNAQVDPLAFGAPYVHR